jgi:hypothetical protein
LIKVGVKNVRNYVTPIFNDLSADLNSAFYHSADLHNVLGFDVGIKFGAAITTDDQRKYEFVTPDFINIKDPVTHNTITLVAGTDYEKSIAGAPTVVGYKSDQIYVHMIRSTTDPVKRGIYDSLVARKGNNNLFQVPGGFDLGAVPLIIPQAAIGLPFGIEVMVRFIPTISSGETGKFNYMGFGIRYNIDQWIRKIPVDVAVHFMTQKMNFVSKDDKDIFSATGNAFGIEVSKKLLIFTVYGGFQLEQSKFTLSKIDGNFEAPDGTLTPYTIPEQTFEGANTSRTTLGFRVLLAMVNVHAEYSIAKIPVLAAGIGVSLR